MKKTALFANALFAFLIPQIVFAQDLSSIMNVLVQIFTGVVAVASVFAFVFFFRGIAVFIFNTDDEKKREAGKKWMLWGVIAIFVMITIWGLVGYLLDTFSVEALPLPPLGTA